MDAGVLGQPLSRHILFSLLDGDAPLSYGSNGQFQMSPGDTSLESDTDSGGGGEGAVLNEDSVSPGSEVDTIHALATQTQLTDGSEPGPFNASVIPTPSLTRVPKPSLTTTISSLSDQIPSRVLSSSLFRSVSPFLSQSRFGSVPVALSSSRSSTCQLCSIQKHSNSATSSLGTTSTPQLQNIPSAVPIRPVSNLGSRPSSWYLGVALASIAGVLLIIILATVVFCWRKVKRRQTAQNIDVPWAFRDEEAGLFFGPRGVSSHGANEAALGNSSQQRIIAPQQFSSYGGDRLTSQPVSSTANESAYSLHDHPIPGSRLFSDEPLPPQSEEQKLGRFVRPTYALRCLPSHLIDEETAARAKQDEAIYASLCDEPSHLRRRSRGHFENIDLNPYINPPVDSNSKEAQNLTSAELVRITLLDRLRNTNKEPTEVLDRLPTPGGDQQKEELEPWASSLKAGFLNAVSALASGIKPQDPSEEGAPNRDKLTRMPTRRRLSLRHNFMHPFSCRGSITKPPGWILHERNDGSGTVQFLPTLEKDYGDRVPTPRTVGLSREKSSESSPSDDEKSTNPSSQRIGISRESSRYSELSLSSSKYDAMMTPHSERLDGLDRNPSSYFDSIVIKPDVLS